MNEQPGKVGNTGAAIMQRRRFRSNKFMDKENDASGKSKLPKLLTVNEVAVYFKVSRATVYRMIETRLIPFYKVSRQIRFSEDDMASYLESQRIKPKNEWFFEAPHKSHPKNPG